MTTKRFLVFVGLWLVALAASVREVSTQFDTPNRAFHNATAFRLEGRHLNVACEACHINGQYAGTPNTCFQCHWIRRKDDRYQLRLGSTCESCHRPTSWTAVTFNHAAVGGVPLGANHATIACDSCHKDAQFTGVAADCVSCHREDYPRATNPNHVTAGFPLTCDSCHRPNDAVWQSTGAAGGFSHAAIFPLVGVHATATCQSCHKNNVFRGTSRECVGCHQADYNATRSPNHAAAGFPTTCDSCHRPTDPSWTGNGAAAGFNHNAVFALVGTHATQQCASCHQNNVYRGTARDCAGCHLNRYNATTAPNHAAAGFPTTCESCHRATDASWQSGSGGFNHNAVFALVGTHASQQCASCHRNSVYRGTARTCAGCHLNRYNATTAPAHAAAGFPTTCESCHRATDARWTGVTFNHTPFFALQGVHATQQCASCHRNNVYRGTARTCAGCHLSRYNATTAPNHASAGFPTTCESCHRATDSSWNQGRFTHTQFPLSGRHNVPCAQCHTTPNNYRVFSCTTCHTRSETDNEHRGRSGYVYDSNACYSCHPNGRGD
ncbi:MAG: cytochrome c3 family protein [Vicinamibacterales bacterium]